MKRPEFYSKADFGRNVAEWNTPHLTEGQFLSEYRRCGRDWQFQWYLLGQRIRIVGAALTAPLVPLVDWLSRKLPK